MSVFVGPRHTIVPLIAIGSLIVSIILFEIYQVRKLVAIIVVLLLIFSNTFTLSYIDERPFTCTLCQYVDENLNDYTTGTESIIDYLEMKPEGTVVQIQPSYMTYPAMFYNPHINYCCQLSRSKELSSNLKNSLPDYLFVENAKPDVLIFAGHQPQQIQEMLNQNLGTGKYRFEKYIENYWQDMTRPELLWHSFEKPATELCKQQGISIFLKTQQSPN